MRNSIRGGGNTEFAAAAVGVSSDLDLLCAVGGLLIRLHRQLEHTLLELGLDGVGVGVASEERLPASVYTAERGRAVYAALARDARATLAAGQAVVVDAVFAAPEARDGGARFTGLRLAAPSEILRQRVGARTGDPSDADGQVVERQQAYVVGELGAWHMVDASGTPAERAREATRRVYQVNVL